MVGIHNEAPQRPAGLLLHGGGGGMVVEGLEDGSNAPLPRNLHFAVGIRSEVAQRPSGLLLHSACTPVTQAREKCCWAEKALQMHHMPEGRHCMSGNAKCHEGIYVSRCS